VIDLCRGSIATGKQFQTVVAKFWTWPVAVSPSLRRITVQGVPAIADALASEGRNPPAGSECALRREGK